jgi:16S rRNA (guanine1207-N2)-methyltransferase
VSQYFEESPEIASRRQSVRLTVDGAELELTTDRGVFSIDRVDAGTRVLLDVAPPPPPTGALLDLGCGYGPIALTLGLRSPGATVWAVDVNERARELTALNAAAAGLTNVRCCAPADVPAELTFATIWSNPPIRVGGDTLHGLLTEWLDRLEVDATGWLVVKRNLGADSLATWLSSAGFPTVRSRSKKGYGILAARRSGPRSSSL